MRTCLTIITLLCLVGCGSSPKTHFYTLSVTPGATGHGISAPVQLTAVHIPPSLDRRQMVRLTSPNSVEISETDRWSAAFDEMVRNVLAQDLAERLPKEKFILPDAPTPAGAGSLVVTLAQFGPDASGVVRLTGSWSLVNNTTGAPVLRHDVHLNAGPAANADATAAAMSHALGQLANAMASALSRSGF